MALKERIASGVDVDMDVDPDLDLDDNDLLPAAARWWLSLSSSEDPSPWRLGMGGMSTM